MMQKERQPGAGSNHPTLSAEDDRAVVEFALATTETAYEWSRIEMRRARGSTFEEYDISIADAKTGVVEASHP